MNTDAASVREWLGPRLVRYRVRDVAGSALVRLRTDDRAPLRHRQIECWVAEVDSALPRGIGLHLSPAERARAESLAIRHRRSYVVSHALLREVLQSYSEGPVHFARGGHGQLRISGPRELADVRVSLSRSRGLVALALARGARVGVDAEPLRRAEEAAEALALLPGDKDRLAQHAHPLLAWTATEAALKAAGHGLGCGRAGCVTDVRHLKASVMVTGRTRRARVEFKLLTIPWRGFQITAATPVLP